ncbi:MAG: acyl-ACP--UDP-N-acetylglucosamine O-acyltransferase [Candidatus Omnitrophica bacterium]|nr:acyl-ACP--UDP-N-acetylglucosamine O-acyltransferase [Candidatus Omnitrophota bacterium]
MSEIHPTAILGKSVQIGKNCVLGPHVVLEDGVKMGSDNKILTGTQICSGTEIGDHNEIHMYSVIGHAPQDLAYKGEATFTKIGNGNVIREFVTIHRGTKPGTSTVIGNSNYLMAYCHVAHNCEIQNHVLMVNQASLTGHCVVEDGAFLSGMTGFHQFTRIGRFAMVSALSAANKDIPPYVTCGGRPAVALGINTVGLRRAGFSSASRAEIKQAFKTLYRSGLNVTQALEIMEKNLSGEKDSATREHLCYLIDFIRRSKRGIIDGAQESFEDSRDTLRPKK